MKKAALHNLGCKVNAYETEAMQELLENNGYEIVPFKEGADVYIVNTCTVTNMADRKSRQMLHRARKMNPEAVIVAAGCYVQTLKEGQKIDPSIDIVIGNDQKQDLAAILEAYEKRHEPNPSVLLELDEIGRVKAYREMHLSKTAEHTRAYIKVQDGCNQFCSYCIIPYARGRVRSRRPEQVVAEVSHLAEIGYQEVVLTGIHLSSYGIDLEEEVTLLSLIQAVHQIEGLKRIRLGSLEPRIITEEFARELADMEKICPHFHLSLQSGCNRTLKRMNRHYTAEEYYEKCCLLREVFEHPALTTDVIVGFPGETEEEFQESMAFLEKVEFYETHIFKYSKREGTKAAVMPNQIPEDVKTKRSNALITLGKENQKKYEKYYMGKQVEVLVEEYVNINGTDMQVGHTREYMKVALQSDRNLQNTIVNVEINKDSQIIH